MRLPAVLLVIIPAALGDPPGPVPSPPRGEEPLPDHLRTRFIPEYDRSLDRIFLATGQSTSTSWTTPTEAQRLVDALPAYTRIDVFAPHPAMLPGGTRRAFLDSPKNIRIFNFHVHPWLQDIGEGTSERFLLGNKGLSYRRKLQHLEVPLVEHFLPLDGGNLQLARNRAGRKLVFIGSREFEEARGIMAAGGHANTVAQAKRMYRETFDADAVVVLPNLDTDHIDQTVLFVADGRAITEALPELSADEQWLVTQYRYDLSLAVRDSRFVKVPLYGPNYKGASRLRLHGEDASPRIAWMSPAQALLFGSYQCELPHFNDMLHNRRQTEQRLHIEAILEAEGFAVTRLSTTVWHQLNCMHFVNAMPFRNRETGRAELLFPVYHHPGESPAKFDMTRLRKHNRRNVAVLESLGIQVRPVHSVSGKGGNLHCMIYQF